jgi:hypothetical protein
MAASCPGPVREDCAQRLDEVVKAMPTVVFDVKDSAGRDLPYVRLSIDDKPVGLVQVTAIPLDPGQHVFRFEAAGALSVEREVVLREGEKQKRVSVVIGPTIPPKVEEPAGASAQPTHPTSSTAARIDELPPNPTLPNASGEPIDGTGNRQRMLGWIAGGVGVAALGVAAALALSAKSSYDHAPTCMGKVCTTTVGIDSTNSARSTGDAASVLGVLGAAAATAGAVVWFSAPRIPAAAAASPPWRIRLTLNGAMAEGAF